MLSKNIITLAISGLLIVASFLGPIKLDAHANEISSSKNPFANQDAQKDLKSKAAKGKTLSFDLGEERVSIQDRKIKENRALMNADSQYIVEFKDKVSLEAIYDIVQNYSYVLLSKSNERVFRIHLTNPEEFKAKTSGLTKNFQKDRRMTSQAITNDPYVGNQWALDAIDIPEAWSITKGSNDVYVTIIDSGVDRQNPDLYDSDIRNGYDFILGDVVNSDSTGHGTNVTGIIAAQTNNLEGIAGVNWNVAVIPLTVVYSDGSIYESDVVSAIYAAADIHSDVINLSLGGPDFSYSMESAINYANSLGCIVVAAAGNGGSTQYQYPASYEGVISAASINNQLVRSSFSQYNDKVDVAAPGESILTTADWYKSGGNNYLSVSGTSFAAPYVSGIAALASALKPALDYYEFFEIIKNTSKDLGSAGYDPYYGYGLIDADHLLQGLSIPPQAPSDLWIASSTYNSNTIQWSPVENASGYEFYRSTSLDGVYARIKTTTLTSYTHGPLVVGSTYFYKVRAYRTVGTNKLFGMFSNTVSSTNLPSIPSGLSVTPSAYNFNSVQWNIVNEAVGYELYRSTSLEGTYVLLKSTTLTSFNHGPLPVGNTYFYKVRSYVLVGSTKVYGKFSEVVSKLTFGAPNNLQTSTYAYNKNNLTWNSVYGATGYELHRATSFDGAYVMLKSTTGLSHLHGPLAVGSTYFYKVRAYVLVGTSKIYSSFSEVISKTTFPAPQNLGISWSTVDTNFLEWQSVEMATGYELYRAINESTTYALLKSTTGRSFRHGPLVYGTTYHYKVRAYVLVGTTKIYSQFSPVIFQTTQ